MAEDVVKSVGRVFEVLELFGSSRQPLNATQVERRLHYPQSSTLALLKSLVKLGYLSFDRIEHSYFPTMRFANLGRWLKVDSSGDRYLLAALAEISVATGHTVALACQNDLQMQWVQIWPGRRPLAADMGMGTTTALFASTIGKVALSAMPDEHIARLVQRFARSGGGDCVDLPVLMADIEEIRRRGHGIGRNRTGDADAVLSWPWTAGDSGRAMAFALVADSGVIEADGANLMTIVRRALQSCP